MLHPSCNRALVYVSLLSPILILQCQIVSFFLPIAPIIFALNDSHKPGFVKANYYIGLFLVGQQIIT